MNLRRDVFLLILVAGLQCKNDPTGPGTNCHLENLYTQDHHFLYASGVFDLRSNPPTQIKNGAIEYALSGQWAFHHDDDPIPYPYSEYFIDTIEFLSPSSVQVHIFESDRNRVYAYIRDDCSLELTSPIGNLHLELTHDGDEITEQRFAIFDHRTKRVTVDTLSFRMDTFLFIEFRLGPFSSYEDIIRQFAFEHPGLYDTVAIELVENKTHA